VRPNESYIISTVTPATSDPFPVRFGSWLFPRRSWIPLPLVAALLLLPAQSESQAWFWAGLAVVLAGEWVRLAGVRQIGVISRTRSDRLGPLVASGPFAWVRNPLYLGNIALWVGITLSARLIWLAPIVAALLLGEYHAIVRWEERLLESRLGDEYLDYAARVPRWVPIGPWPKTQGSKLTAQGSERTARGARPRTEGGTEPRFGWRETLFSERGTLIAIALGYVLVLVKARV